MPGVEEFVAGGKSASRKSSGPQHADHGFANRFFVVDYCYHGRCTTLRAFLVRSFEPAESWTLGLLPVERRGTYREIGFNGNPHPGTQLHEFRDGSRAHF